MSILLSPSTGLDDNESKDNIPPLFFDNKLFIFRDNAKLPSFSKFLANILE